MKVVCCALLFLVPAVAQKLAPFDYSFSVERVFNRIFGAELATSESSGHGSAA